MTTYNTGNPLGSTDARDLYDNAQNLDNFANGTASSYTDRLGVSRRSLAGINSAADNVLNSIGYAVPVAYASGISLTLTSQTVEYNGVVYAPKSSSLPFTTSSWGTDEAKFRAVQVTDADLITYTPAGTSAVPTTVQSKLREMVSVKDFGAVGDGVTDDTAAVHAAVNYAKGRRGAVFFPSGTYRVTSGYTQSVTRADVHLYGEGSTRERPGGSQIKLDSADPASFFYRSTANHNLQVNDLVFSCAQFVQDRAFFKLGANTSQFFTRVNFESVERPIVWPSGAYFQSAAYRDVQFRGSGTFHSETTSLIGTLLVLDNVNHETTVPANTEKVVCNLSGIRLIHGTNFLLEGASPGAGWTILKLGEIYDVDWVGAATANFDGFWIEFSGTSFDYCVDQTRGMVKIKNTNSFLTEKKRYRLSEKAIIELDGASFTSTAFDPSLAFELNDANCTVILKNCAVMNASQLIKQRIFYDGCFMASSNNNMSMARFSSAAPELLYSYDGKPFDNTLLTFGAFGGSYFRQETDATNGRKLSVYPSSNHIDANVRVNGFGQFAIGDQFLIKIRAKLPAFTGNYIQFMVVSNATVIGSYSYDAATYSDQTVTLTFPFRLAAAATSVGFGIGTTGGVTSVTGPVEIYHLEIYRGGTFTNGYRTAYPKCVTFHATAAPTTGSWAVGDRAINSAPAVGQPKSWVCTVAGTPGTWVSEGNL